MAIGGFNGSDPSPTLAQFQQDVADGKIHYFLAGGGIGQSAGRQQRGLRDRQLGRVDLHAGDDRWLDVLRPHADRLRSDGHELDLRHVDLMAGTREHRLHVVTPTPVPTPAPGEAHRLPRLGRQVTRFATIGVVSTALHLGLFTLLHPGLGDQVANLVALVVATVLNTAANRAWTFGVRGSDGLGRHHLQSLAVFAMTWGVTSGALALLGLWWPEASSVVTVGTVAAANVLSTAVRFVAMRRWIFRPAAHGSAGAAADAA